MGVATVIAVACTRWLLRRKQRQGNASPGSPQPPRSSEYPVLLFHCGEQPHMVEHFRSEALTHGFSAKVDTLDRFEDWVAEHNVRASPCPLGARRPPPCVFIVNTGEDFEVTSKVAAACVLFLARKPDSGSSSKQHLLLEGFRFAVLGLGDSNHLAASHRSISWASGKDCNQNGELFDRWLGQRGGARIVRRGESDLRTDHDALAPWLEGLWTALQPERSLGAKSLKG